MSSDAMKQALENSDATQVPEGQDAITALRLAIEQAERQEPVAHPVVAGALFDFMGWLTTRDERLVLSSVDDAGAAVEAIRDFAKMRNLSLDDAQVQEWQQTLAAPPQHQPEPEETALRLAAQWTGNQPCPKCGFAALHCRCAPPPRQPLMDVTKALEKAFRLGQTYWQQADSDYTSQHRKADETMAQFRQLVAEHSAHGIWGEA